MHLEKYISDLLYRYECVVVPFFGAFLTQRSSATIHQTTNAFYPPKKILSFNDKIITSDGVLVNYIAEAEQIPLADASSKINDRVAVFNEKLQRGETIELKHIGSLSLNNDNKIIFEPSYHLNYLTESFGLSQLVSPEIHREVYTETVKAIEEKTPIAITPTKRKSVPYLKYAAVALIAVTLGGLMSSNYYVSSIHKHNQMAQEEANKQLDAKIQEATFVIPNPLPAITLKLNAQSGNYHIIAGAFREEENSEKRILQLNEKGYNARKLGKNRYGLHQVAYASYETRSEALKALRTIRKTSNPEAWLLIKNLK